MAQSSVHARPDPVRQPIVILGGFLSFPRLYQDMRAVLAQIVGQPVWIVEAWPHDWVRTVSPAGWAHLLGQLERTVQHAVRDSVTGKVTLIGHSSGGVMARLYLADQSIRRPTPFAGKLMGHAYCGLDKVDRLITLGSPHYNLRVGRMRRLVEEQYPGSYFPQVRYASVAGKGTMGRRHGSLRERWAYRSYERLSGEGDVWGDGLVPVSSALLHGSQQIVLEDVGHFAGFGRSWYGTPEIVSRWWHKNDALYLP